MNASVYTSMNEAGEGHVGCAEAISSPGSYKIVPVISDTSDFDKILHTAT